MPDRAARCSHSRSRNNYVRAVESGRGTVENESGPKILRVWDLNRNPSAPCPVPGPRESRVVRKQFEQPNVASFFIRQFFSYDSVKVPFGERRTATERASFRSPVPRGSQNFCKDARRRGEPRLSARKFIAPSRRFRAYRGITQRDPN